jgi:hypothetical protein
MVAIAYELVHAIDDEKWPFLSVELLCNFSLGGIENPSCFVLSLNFYEYKVSFFYHLYTYFSR